MDRLEAMTILLRVIDKGSFSAASRDLGVPLATVSRKVSELEQHSSWPRFSSGAGTDAGPVFDMIAKSAARLCAAQFCHAFRFDGELIHFVASHGHSAKALAIARAAAVPVPGCIG